MFKLSVFRAVAFTILFLLSGPAQAAEWRVVKIIGDGWVDNGNAARKIALTSGQELSGTAIVTTGRTGTVVLVRGRESMIVGPGAIVEIPASRHGRTTIRQSSGIVHYDVQKRNVRHFEVRTPDIVAVVKGTKFTVTQNRLSSTVSVREGSVQVTHPDSGSRSFVKPGQKAIIRGGKRGHIRLVKSVTQSPVTAQPRTRGRASTGNSSNDNSGDDNTGGGVGNANSGNRNSGNGNSGGGNPTGGN
jgi:hypothetical protein